VTNSCSQHYLQGGQQGTRSQALSIDRKLWISNAMHCRHSQSCYRGIFISITTRPLLAIYEEHTEKGQWIYRFKIKTKQKNTPENTTEKPQTNVYAQLL